MPAAAMYEPVVPAMVATSVKQLPLRSAPTTKDTATTTLRMSTPLSLPAGAAPPQSVAASDAVPSLTNGGSSSSASSAPGTDHVDLITLMGDRLAKVADPTPMDRSLAKQAQASGELNAKNREIEEMRALLARRTKSAKKNFAEGISAAKQVKKDLEYIQKNVSVLNIKAAEKHPEAFAAASAKAAVRSR